MKRFHVAIAVRDFPASVAEYSQRLGRQPNVVAGGKYALWRTALLNFVINLEPAIAGTVRHIGFEDDSASGISSSHDLNGIEWETFPPKAQDDRIEEIYGVKVSD